MSDSEGTDKLVEQGEIYNHVEEEEVEVQRIWQGVQQVDEARNTEEKNVIVVRYSTEGDDGRVNEFTDTLEGFLEAIE